MRPSVEAFLAGESLPLVGILRSLLYGFGGVILSVMYTVTDWGRLRSSTSTIPEDTRDICIRDVQLIEQNGILNKTNHFERLGVSASHGCL